MHCPLLPPLLFPGPSPLPFPLHSPLNFPLPSQLPFSHILSYVLLCIGFVEDDEDYPRDHDTRKSRPRRAHSGHRSSEPRDLFEQTLAAVVQAKDASIETKHAWHKFAVANGANCDWRCKEFACNFRGRDPRREVIDWR